MPFCCIAWVQIAAGAEVIHDEIIDYAAQSCSKEELLELCDKLRAAPGSLQPIEDRVDSLRTDEERDKLRRRKEAQLAAKVRAYRVATRLACPSDLYACVLLRGLP